MRSDHAAIGARTLERTITGDPVRLRAAITPAVLHVRSDLEGSSR